MSSTYPPRQLDPVPVWEGVRTALIDRGELDRAVAEAVVGSIQRRVVSGLRAGELAGGHAFVPELMCIAVRPYLGRQAAREGLTIPPPSGTDGYRERCG